MSEDNIQVAAKRELAATLLARGWKLLALHDVTTGRCSCLPRADGSECKPGNQGKHPRMGGAWQTQGMSTPEQVNEWLLRAPDMNVGILTGPASGIWALDVDPKNGGDVALAELERVHGPLPPTWSQTTGSGGRHYLFRLPDDFTPTGSPGRLPPGLDVRGVNGQIVGPGSRTLLGGYKALDNDAPVLAAPGWLLDLIRPAAPDYDRMPERAEGWVAPAPAGTPDAARQHAYAVAAVNAELGKLSVATPGSRGYTAYTVACNLIELLNSPWTRLEGGGVWAGYLAAAAQAASYGGAFDEREAVTSWGSAARHVGHQGRPVPPEPTIGGAITLPGPIGGVPPFAGLAPDPVTAGLIPWPREGMAHTPAEQGGLTPTHADSFEPFNASVPFAPLPVNGAHPEVMAAAHRMRVRDAAKEVRDAEVRATAAGDLGVRAAALRAVMLERKDLPSIPKLKPLIDGYLMRNTLARVNGPSGHGKSFVLIDMAACVATGVDWHGHAVSQGEVWYIVAEGAEGIDARVSAWEAAHGTDVRNIKFIPMPVQVGGPEWEALEYLAGLERPAMVIGDTQARITVGVDENSAQDMGVVVSQLERLRVASGACVLLVHHTGVNGEHGRGSSAVRGAMQTELAVTKVGLVVTVRTVKQKDHEQLPDFDLVMRAQQGTGSVALVRELDPQARREEADMDVAGLLGELARTVFFEGEGGSKSEYLGALRERRRCSKAQENKAWNKILKYGVIGKIKGTSKWIYVPVDERSKMIEPTTGLGETGGKYAPPSSAPAQGATP